LENEQKHTSIKDWAVEDMPREKLLAKGAASLTNAELLAILINTGTRNRSALDIAKEVLDLAGQDLLNVEQLNYDQLKKVKGLGPKKVVTLLASIELGKRGKLAKALVRKKITTSGEAFNLLLPFYSDFTKESCVALFMDHGNKLVSVVPISSGGMTATVVDPKILFRKALETQKTTQIILSHNHPSGNIRPSEADKRMTTKILEAGKLLDIRCVDHLIIGHNEYYSFADAAMMV
jgi:DNA repair protein RadC